MLLSCSPGLVAIGQLLHRILPLISHLCLHGTVTFIHYRIHHCEGHSIVECLKSPSACGTSTNRCSYGHSRSHRYKGYVDAIVKFPLSPHFICLRILFDIVAIIINDIHVSASFEGGTYCEILCAILSCKFVSWKTTLVVYDRIHVSVPYGSAVVDRVCYEGFDWDTEIS